MHLLAVLAGYGQRVFAVSRGQDAVAKREEHLGDRLPCDLLILDEKDGAGVDRDGGGSVLGGRGGAL